MIRDRSFLITQMCTVWVVQMALFYFISEETYARVVLEFPQDIPSVKITFTRFVSGLAMHLAMQAKL